MHQAPPPPCHRQARPAAAKNKMAAKRLGEAASVKATKEKTYAMAVKPMTGGALGVTAAAAAPTKTTSKLVNTM